METGNHGIGRLFEENNVILSVLNAVEKETIRLFDGEPLRLDFWREAVDFLETFAHRSHHEKEEAILFPALTEAGFEEGEPTLLAGMLAAHRDGLRRLARVKTAVQNENRKAVEKEAGAYAFLFREHLQTENMTLFPVAREMIPDEDGELLSRWLEWETKQLGEEGVAPRLVQGRELCRTSRVDFHGMHSVTPKCAGQ